MNDDTIKNSVPQDKGVDKQPPTKTPSNTNDSVEHESFPRNPPFNKARKTNEEKENK